jgi:Enoyl-(Acyl carrier protein) reductase
MAWPQHLAVIKELLALDGRKAMASWFEGRELGVDTYSFTKQVIQVWTMREAAALQRCGIRINSGLPRPDRHAAGGRVSQDDRQDEYGRARVRFNAIQPGFIATEVMQAVEPGGPVWQSYVSQTPLGDVGQPEDIANVACFLLSAESRWITGKLLAVDGGHCLRRGPDFSAVVERRFGPDALDPARR